MAPKTKTEDFTPTYGSPVPVVYGAALVPTFPAWVLWGAPDSGYGWAYNGDLERWDAVSSPLDGTCATSYATTTFYVSTLALPGNRVQYNVKNQGMWVAFRTGANAGQMRQVAEVNISDNTIRVSPAFPSIPAAGDQFSLGLPLKSTNGKAVLGLCVAPVQALGRVWMEDGPPEASFAYAQAPGATAPTTVIAETSAAWSELVGSPAEGQAFTGLVQARFPSINLPGGSVPTIDVEVFGLGTTWEPTHGKGIKPRDALVDLLTVRLPEGYRLAATDIITDLGSDGNEDSSYDTYCGAMDFWVARAVDGVTDAASLVQELLEQTNSVAVPIEGGGKIRIVPLGDQPVTRSTYTYTPPSTGIALGVNDITRDGQSTMTAIRTPETEVYNTFPVTFRAVHPTTDRADDYTETTLEWMDPYHSSVFGVRRADAYDATWINSADHAAKLASLLAKRSIMVRNTYRFRLPYALLEPMDLITLTEPAFGLVAAPARIVSIEEDADGSLSVEAWEWPAGVSTPAVVTAQALDGALSAYTTSSPTPRTLVDGLANAAQLLAEAEQRLHDANTLTPSEKPALVAEVQAITDEYGGIYNATLSARSENATVRAAYAAAYTALVTTYLPAQASPVLWSSLDDYTTITRTAWDTAFCNYYLAKVALLNANADLARVDASDAYGLAQGKASKDLSDITVTIPSLIGSGNITETMLDSNSVTSPKVAANTITAKHLVLANFDNLIPNATCQNVGSAGDFEQASLEVVAGIWTPSGRVRVINTSGGSDISTMSPAIPVIPGETYLLEASIAADAGLNATDVYFLVFNTGVWDWSRQVGGPGNAISTNLSSPTRYSTSPSSPITIPAGVNSITVVIWSLAGQVAGKKIYFGDFVLRKMADAKLLVDGSITTGKLNFGTVTVGTGPGDSGALTAKVVGSINASSEGITISAAKIAIDGTTTFSAGYNPSTKVAAGGAAADVNANSTTITGNLIRTGSVESNDGKAKLDLTNARLVFNNGTVAHVIGNGFGASSDLIEWVGIGLGAVGSENFSFPRADNSMFCVKTDGTVQFAGLVTHSITGDSSTATGYIQWSSPPATNTATSNTVTVTPTGGGPSYTYSWDYVSGHAGFTCVGAATASAYWTHSSGAGIFEALWRCTCTSNGNTATWDVTVTMTHDLI